MEDLLDLILYHVDLMMERRNYKQIVDTLKINNKNKTFEIFYLNKITEKVVYIISFESDISKEIVKKNFNENIKEQIFDELIIILNDNVVDTIYKEIYTHVRNNDYYFKLFKGYSFLFDITKHFFQPESFKVLNEKDKSIFLSYYNIKNDNNEIKLRLKSLKTIDTMVKYYDFKENDIIFINRSTFPDYKVVVKSDELQSYIKLNKHIVKTKEEISSEYTKIMELIQQEEIDN